MYALNLSEDGRILSACVCLAGQTYDNVVETIPNDNITNYKYINSQYIYDPLPAPEPPEAQPSLEDRINEAESNIDYIAMMSGIEIPTEV